MQDMYSGYSPYHANGRKWCYEIFGTVISKINPGVYDRRSPQNKAKLVDRPIPKFLPITPPDEMYNACGISWTQEEKASPSALLLQQKR